MTEAELIILYRDIFAEITAKEIPVSDPESDDPERVRHYIVPVGPVHRAAGKLNFQMFDHEKYMRDVVTRLRDLESKVEELNRRTVGQMRFGS